MRLVETQKGSYDERVAVMVSVFLRLCLLAGESFSSKINLSIPIEKPGPWISLLHPTTGVLHGMAKPGWTPGGGWKPFPPTNL